MGFFLPAVRIVDQEVETVIPGAIEDQAAFVHAGQLYPFPELEVEVVVAGDEVGEQGAGLGFEQADGFELLVIIEDRAEAGDIELAGLYFWMEGCFEEMARDVYGLLVEAGLGAGKETLDIVIYFI